MKVLRLIDTKLEYWLCTILYAYIIAMIFIEVFTRFVLKFSYIWAVETAIYAFIWMCYISMARIARNRSHLAFTSLRDSAAQPVKLVLMLVSDVLLLGLSVVIIVNIYVPIADNILFDQRMTGVDLPLWLATAAVPFGWALLVFRVLQRSYQSIYEFRNDQPLSVGNTAVE